MISFTTQVQIKGITGADVAAFMLNCTDADYQNWWPGTHLAFHTIRRVPGDVGNLVLFDEYVGRRRLRFEGVVVEHIPSKRIAWQMKKVVKLPGWLILSFTDNAEGVTITHELAVGFKGGGRILDPLLRLFLSNRFEEELAEHARFEFTRLPSVFFSGIEKGVPDEHARA
jgi:hypothetical protein